MPPRHRGCNEASRRQLVVDIFKSVDTARQRADGAVTCIAGDLNPDDDINDLFEEHLRKRHMKHAIPEDVATHVKGRRLDTVCIPVGPTRVPAFVQPLNHNGKHCRLHGCSAVGCGILSSILGSKDLDHYPITWRHASGVCRQGNLPRLLFSRDPTEWYAVLQTFAAPPCMAMAAEIRSSLGALRVSQISRTVGRDVVQSIAVLWRSLVLMAADLGGICSCSMGKNPGKWGADVELAQAFQSLCRIATSVSNEPGHHDSAAKVHRARAHWRRLAVSAKRSQRKALQVHLLSEAAEGRFNVEAIFSGLVGSKPSGLPLCIHDSEEPDMVLIGTDSILEGAVRYILRRGDPPWSCEWDSAYVKEVNSKLRILMEESVDDTRALWSDSDQYTKSLFQEAKRNIKNSASCLGIPYAAILAESLPVIEALLATCSMSKRFGVVPALWLQQVAYHQGKPHKSRLSFDGFRELALQPLEARLLEELWALCAANKVKAAWGPLQDGGGDPLVAAALDFEVHAIRSDLQLPSGDLFTDKMEAFDRQWQAEALVILGTRAMISGGDYLMACDMLTRNALRVTSRGQLSRAINPPVGMGEGKKLSPLEYCLVAASEAEEIDEAPGIGIGLNPPPEAVAAYHKSADNTDGLLDLDEVEAWMTLIESGTAWEEIMPQVSTDTIRLALLSASSSIRVGARVFVDDLRCKVESRGQALFTRGVIRKAEAKHHSRLRYGPGKSEICAPLLTLARSTNSCSYQNTSAWALPDLQRIGVPHIYSRLKIGAVPLLGVTCVCARTMTWSLDTY